MELLFELVCELLALLLEPVYNVFMNKNGQIPNKTLRKIAKWVISVLFFIVILVIYICLSKLMRGYWI